MSLQENITGDDLPFTTTTISKYKIIFIKSTKKKNYIKFINYSLSKIIFQLLKEINESLMIFYFFSFNYEYFCKKLINKP
jgi:hypothetical protein